VIALSLLLGLAAAALLLPTASDLISLGRVLLGQAGRRPRPSSVGQPRLLFLVPAHNEALLIEACVRSLTGLRYPPARYSVVVIADNCADRTAALARTAGPGVSSGATRPIQGSLERSRGRWTGCRLGSTTRW